MRLPPPRASLALVAATTIAYLLVTASGRALPLALGGGFLPARFWSDPFSGVWPWLPFWLTPLSCTLLHGSLGHLGFNMVALAYCGRFVEAALGSWRFVVLYVLGAYGAALGQFISGPHSAAPMIGASGAVSAVLAAQAILFGSRPDGEGAGSRGQQMLSLGVAWIGIQALTGIAMGGTVAIAAHIGGFIVGLIAAAPLLRSRARR
jgi:membrane associated rhomboid family serine protease